MNQAYTPEPYGNDKSNDQPYEQAVPSPATVSSEVSISQTISVSLILGCLMWLIVCVSGIFILFQGNRHSNQNPTVILVIPLLAIYALTCLSRLPFKYRLDGDRITTYSLRGTHSMQLSSISKIKRVAIAGGYGASINALKFIDNDGKAIFVQLGSLPKDQRQLFYNSLNQIIESQGDSRVDKLWKRWI